MSDVEVYRGMCRVINAAVHLGIAVELDRNEITLRFSSTGRAHRFITIAEAKAFLDGHRAAIEFGKEPGCKL